MLSRVCMLTHACMVVYCGIVVWCYFGVRVCSVVTCCLVTHVWGSSPSLCPLSSPSVLLSSRSFPSPLSLPRTLSPRSSTAPLPLPLLPPLSPHSRSTWRMCVDLQSCRKHLWESFGAWVTGLSFFNKVAIPHVSRICYLRFGGWQLVKVPQ